MLKIGDEVQMVNCPEAKMYGDKIWSVRSAEWECCGSNMVLLEGKTGGFDTIYLKKVIKN